MPPEALGFFFSLGDCSITVLLSGRRSLHGTAVPCPKPGTVLAAPGFFLGGMGKASRVRAVPCKAGMVGHQATCCNRPLLQQRTRYRLRTLGPHFASRDANLFYEDDLSQSCSARCGRPP